METTKTKRIKRPLILYYYKITTMKLTKQLKEYLQWFDFYDTFEVANTIADYVEKKHEDNREIKDEYRELAKRYIKSED